MMQSQIDFALATPEILLLIFGLAILLIDAVSNHPERKPTFLLTMLALGVLTVVSAVQWKNGVAGSTFNGLYVMGMIEASGIGWQGRYEQAELIAEYLAALERDPERAAEFRRRATSEPWPDLTGGYKYLGLERMSYYVNKDAYRRAVRAATTALRGDARDAAPGRGIRSSRRRSKKVPA